MNGMIDYKPIAPELQSALVNTMRTIRTDDVVKLGGIFGLVVVIGIGCVCFSGSELIIARDRFEIKRPAPVAVTV